MGSTLFLLDVDAVVLVGHHNDLQILMDSVSRETDKRLGLELACMLMDPTVSLCSPLSFCRHEGWRHDRVKAPPNTGPLHEDVHAASLWLWVKEPRSTLSQPCERSLMFLVTDGLVDANTTQH